MSFVSEFKAFAMRGSVVDLAVGVVIGAAFGKVVSALVDGIIMPPIGLALGGVNFGELAVTLKDAVLGPDGKEIAGAVVLKYGAFFQTVIDFLIIAVAIFVVVKVMNSLKKREEVPAPGPSEEVKLLTEIRDSLKAR